MKFRIMATEANTRERFSLGHADRDGTYFLARLPNCCHMRFPGVMDAEKVMRIAANKPDILVQYGEIKVNLVGFRARIDATVAPTADFRFDIERHE